MMFSIDVKESLKYLPFALAAGAVVYGTVKAFRKDTSNWINKSYKKDTAKVADAYNAEELGETTCFCRCWKSSKFPLCDGSHNGYNLVTGDNVGPVIIKKKKKVQE